MSARSHAQRYAEYQAWASEREHRRALDEIRNAVAREERRRARVTR